jgi:hypothetical protein
MDAQNVGFWVGVAATIVCAIYAALGYHLPKRESTKAGVSRVERTFRYFLWIPLLSVALVWAAVGLEFYTRPEIASGQLVNYGIDSAQQFHGVGVFRHWKDYEKFKALLITRTVFVDRDRLTDDWIAKSIPYSIERPTVVMVVHTNREMHFASNLPNLIEYNFAVIPPDVSPTQILTLSDVQKLGGKILATASQGGIMGAPPPAQITPQ